MAKASIRPDKAPEAPTARYMGSRKCSGTTSKPEGRCPEAIRNREQETAAARDHAREPGRRYRAQIFMFRKRWIGPVCANADVIHLSHYLFRRMRPTSNVTRSMTAGILQRHHAGQSDVCDKQYERRRRRRQEDIESRSRRALRCVSHSASSPALEPASSAGPSSLPASSLALSEEASAASPPSPPRPRPRRRRRRLRLRPPSSPASPSRG